jgi:hypothetical protein
MPLTPICLSYADTFPHAVVNAYCRLMFQFHDECKPLVEDLIYRPVGQAPHDKVIDISILLGIALEYD